MFSTPEIYLQAELAYRRDRAKNEILGTPVRRPRSGWLHGHRRAVSVRRKPTVISQAH